MEKQELIAKINEALADEFEVEAGVITPEANIKKTLQLDSLSLVDMVALIEEAFGVSIKGAEVSGIQTFGALYDFVYNRMQQK
jgi:acyl carrier protein